MKLSYRAVENVQILICPDNLTRRDIPQIMQQLQQLATPATHFVIDLAAVQQVDIQGLSLLLTAAKLLKPHDGQVVLLNPSHAVHQLLSQTHLHRAFAIYADEAVAVADLLQSHQKSHSNQ